VNQSRVFTLEGGDMTIVSQSGNIDAGKGAKTVQAIQPPSVRYDTYGNETITSYGSASGSGIAVLHTLSSVPLGNVDLIAFAGSVNAGDAGIRVSGNLNVAAVEVLNAGNIQVGGTATGVPVVLAPNIGALTSASNTAGSETKAIEQPASPGKGDQPSIIIVEFLGFGGGDGDPEQKRNPEPERHSQDPSSPVQVIGGGVLTPEQQELLTDTERRRFVEP
jgi:hypothetical protein